MKDAIVVERQAVRMCGYGERVWKQTFNGRICKSNGESVYGIIKRLFVVDRYVGGKLIGHSAEAHILQHNGHHVMVELYNKEIG